MTRTTIKSKTRNVIAFSILFVFSGLLIALLVVAYHEEKEVNGWLDLFKSGFILLGGAFTTFMGYYFGAKSGENAMEQAYQREKKTIEKEKELVEKEVTVRQQELEIQQILKQQSP